MDPATLTFYEKNAEDVSTRYEAVASPMARYCEVAFPKGGRLLDIGAGSGRDLAHLLRLGYDGWGVEPCQELREKAFRYHPELRERLGAASLPELGQPFGGKFDGILCCAVLMHLPQTQLFDAAFALRAVLRPHGRLLVSLPSARSDLVGQDRDAGGRLFMLHPPHYVQLLFERLGFARIGHWESGDFLGREGISWYTSLFELASDSVVRPIDQIEGILNRDKKTATYKLALFRALAEIAMQEPRLASFRSGDVVAVPIRRVAEKWMAYYWPILAAARFVPQSSAEGSNPDRALHFRAPMATFMDQYRGQGSHGGLSAWYLDCAAQRLPPERQVQQGGVLQAIEKAIREGPVVHAGGALETGAVFWYERASRSIGMDAGLWRELSLLGHWIVDAVILRWAQQTARFGAKVDAGEVLPLLVAVPEPERITEAAGRVYRAAANAMQCVWSGRILAPGDMVVDHAIPFALWGNNDLWNLLPAHDRVNNNKSDKLPSAALLRERRGAIFGSWSVLREALPEAFDRQAAHLLGGRPHADSDCRPELYDAMRESIEVAALQRGIERWTP